MGEEWDFRNEATMIDRDMEEMLIEVFGCVSPDKRIINLDSGRARMRREASLDGIAMEEMLIEVFGCVSVRNRVIRLEPGRENKWEQSSRKIGAVA